MIDIQARKYPTCICSAFGRLFYGAEGRVYFSQVFIDDIGVLGKCYQNNDPTSSEISDVLATDGGEILIQNTGAVYDIIPFNTGVLVLTSRGIWFVGQQGISFSAVDYAVQKISDEGVVGYNSSTESVGSVYYVADSGIHRIAVNENGQIKSDNLTEFSINSVIQDFLVQGTTLMYNRKDRTLHVFDAGTNTEFVFEERTQGWYKNQYSSGTHQSSVYDKDSGQVFLYYSTDDTEVTYGFSTKTSDSFEDYGVTYESFIQSQPETLGKFSHDKRVTSMKVMFQKTEEEITGYDDEAAEYTYDSPSSCLFTAKWDFDGTGTGLRWTAQRDIYKPLQRKLIPEYYPFPFDTGETIISTKLGVRGYGKAIQFRFDAEPNKDMQILGYTVEYRMRGKQ
ncbi:T7-like tubular tail B family-like protein [Pseudoalteromonas phage RIO-1]|uniref:T7-like tubular tail B family-like protein n=1 Tax=Pseudoalteromonas phage RIO-1 TaxID=1316739 RepID=R4JKJ3_9CAUD|nr:tail appendage [Pseudoalteromonas phage RIO-1]AGK87054.1 T7-like tubular tail B family-like protein [Pseudoalteromonas phage RIO-1]